MWLNIDSKHGIKICQQHRDDQNAVKDVYLAESKKSRPEVSTGVRSDVFLQVLLVVLKKQS